MADGALPLLAPMSEVAGRMAPQVGAHSPGAGARRPRRPARRRVGVYAAKVVVIGAGVSGMNAAAIALGMQAEVIVLDRDVDKLRAADRIYQGHMQTVASNSYEVERAVLDADLVIGAVLVPGAKAPTLISNELVSRMKPGSVLVDIAVDQGGCFEDTRPPPTTTRPYRVHDSVFYCVANMPGAVPNTSTLRADQRDAALRRWRWPTGASAAACARPPDLALGLNVVAGQVVLPEVAQAHGLRRPTSRRCWSEPPPVTAAGRPDRAGDSRRPRRWSSAVVAAYLDHLVGGARPGGEHDRRPTAATCAATPSSSPRPACAALGEVTERDVAGFLTALRQGDDEHPPLSATLGGAARWSRSGGCTGSRCSTGWWAPTRRARGPPARRRPAGCPRRSRSSRWSR